MLEHKHIFLFLIQLLYVYGLKETFINEDIHHRISLLENKVADLENENAHLAERMTICENECVKPKALFSNSQTTDKSDTDKMNLTTKDTTQNAKDFKQRPSYSDRNIRLAKRRENRIVSKALEDGKIAFTATNSNDIGHLGNHQTIVFDRVVTNTGNQYNQQRGVFTTSVSGFYVFFVELRAMDHATLYAEIVKDGSTLVVTFAAAPNVKYHHRSDSNMAVVHLNQGESVWVKTVEVYQQTGLLVDYGSSFSGFLLYRD